MRPLRQDRATHSMETPLSPSQSSYPRSQTPAAAWCCCGCCAGRLPDTNGFGIPGIQTGILWTVGRDTLIMVLDQHSENPEV